MTSWLCHRAELVPTINFRCIGRRDKKGDIIGVVGYDNYTGSSVQMHVAGEGNWLSRNFLAAIFDYPFRVMKVKMAYAIICSTNHKSLKFNQHIGFKFEHTLKDMFRDGDGIVLSMRAKECRYLKDNAHG